MSDKLDVLLDKFHDLHGERMAALGEINETIAQIEDSLKPFKE